MKDCHGIGDKGTMNNQASLDELRAFVAVVETGGFTSAARRLHLTTNGVSLRVQRLEARLQVRLFTRTTRRVAPTTEGRSYYQRVREGLDVLEVAEEELHAHRGLVGAVHLGLPGSVITPGLLSRLRELLDEEAHLELEVRVHHGVPDLIAEGLDLALVVGPIGATSWVGRRLGQAQWALAAAPSYRRRHGLPEAPADLAKHRCLRAVEHPPQDQWTLVDRRGRQVTVPVGRGFTANDSRTLAEATYAGLGIGIRPEGELRRAEAQGQLLRVLPDHHFRPLEGMVLAPKGRLRVPRIARCLEALQQTVNEPL